MQLADERFEIQCQLKVFRSPSGCALVKWYDGLKKANVSVFITHALRVVTVYIAGDLWDET